MRKPAFLMPFGAAVFISFTNLTTYAAAAGVDCAPQRVAEGCGTWVWPDGSKYVGGFHGGNLSGRGVITYKDGSRLDGDFSNSSALGVATFVFPDGKTITGRYQDVSRDAAHPHTPVRFPFWRAFFGDKANVQLTVIVEADGTVSNVQVDYPTGSPSFDQAAVEGVRQWRFLPATIDGHPIKAPYVIILQFASSY